MSSDQFAPSNEHGVRRRITMQFSLRFLFLLMEFVGICIASIWIANSIFQQALGFDAPGPAFLQAVFLQTTFVWLPFIILAYAIGRRALSDWMILFFGVAEIVALVAMKWALSPLDP